eukprot:Gb_15146 [translate_table: standard]
MARATSGLVYPERFHAAAAYAGFGESAKPADSRFPKETALLLYGLYQQYVVLGKCMPEDRDFCALQCRTYRICFHDRRQSDLVTFRSLDPGTPWSRASGLVEGLPFSQLSDVRDSPVRRCLLCLVILFPSYSITKSTFSSIPPSLGS